MFASENFVNDGKNMLIYTYSTKHLLKKDKVRFYYALKGRDGKSGIVKEMRIEQLGRAVLMVPEFFRNDMDQFIRIWNLPYSVRKVLVDKNIESGGSK